MEDELRIQQQRYEDQLAEARAEVEMTKLGLMGKTARTASELVSLEEAAKRTKADSEERMAALEVMQEEAARVERAHCKVAAPTFKRERRVDEPHGPARVPAGVPHDAERRADAGARGIMRCMRARDPRGNSPSQSCVALLIRESAS